MQVGYVRHEMKQRIKLGIPEEQRVVIRITQEIENDIEVFKRIHSREFRYKGEMYDVLSSETKGDTTVYTCIHDVRESGLFNDLDRLVNQQVNYNPKEKENKEFAASFFNQHYLPFENISETIPTLIVSTIPNSEYVALQGFSSTLFRPPIC